LKNLNIQDQLIQGDLTIAGTGSKRVITKLSDKVCE